MAFRFDTQQFNNRHQPTRMAQRGGRVRALHRQAAELGLTLAGAGDRLTVHRDGGTLAAGDVEVVAAFINRHRLNVRRYSE